ncbi:type I DNA topoisomerase [Porticoccaceae bacterium]|jgi:DNA topoisomerase-1|nr:type I DNA topoisomerase [Porticoccaceae bacterium]
MGKSLVIVESPAKAKTINRYLGDDFVVKSSVGHVRDLPTGANRTTTDPKERARQAAITRKMSAEEKVVHKQKKTRTQLVKSMGIDPENDWQAEYAVLPGKEKVVAELKKLAKNADTVYLATDMDREGEAIAWHLTKVIGGEDSRYKRVVFNEITKKAIRKAFEDPGELDTNRVDAQQARRFLDRVVGFMVSPLLWAKVGRGLSAGRVQSVAVKLIVEREREIRAFIPEEYWTVQADLENQQGQDSDDEFKLRFDIKKYQGKGFRPVNKDQADTALATLREADYVVSKREDKPTKSKPSAPFITSTLQQGASTRLGFGVKKTMMMAQRLYEAGYITYMRTDSTNLSADAVGACRDFIQQRFGAKYLPEEPISYSSKSGAQDAHEAIRPSNVDISPGDLGDMEVDARRLYQMIWQQFVACQMAQAEFTATTITVAADDYEMQCKGRVTRFDGYLAVMPARDEDDELPDLQAGDPMNMLALIPQQHFTKPTARYSEAALVKDLEKRGIGRPSTYASIISTIQDRGYVRIENKRLYAEKIGDIVTDRLSENFTDLMDYGFTATMEEQLDDIAEGKLNWKQLLNRFYGDFSQKVGSAQNEEGGMRPNSPSATDIECSKCGRPMMIRTAGTGVFLGCSGYALPPKERCKHTVNLTAGDEAVNIEEDDEAESKLLLHKHRCKLCNTSMDSYLLDETRKLHVCGNNPDCIGHEVEFGQYVIKGYEGPVIDCDKCGSEMQLKTGRFGKYFGCTGETAPDEPCKNTRKLLRNGEAAPPKVDPIAMPELRCLKVEDHYVLRDGASGIFLAASQFPRHRETRAPLVTELLPYKEQIDSKYQFLLTAPTEDPDGLPTVVRYSRKTKEQYVRSENDGKPSGWSAFYSNGRWAAAEKGSS